MNITAKVKRIYPPETFAFEDGRAYTYTDKKDNVTQREGYSLKANAYDIKVLEQSPLVQAVQQSMSQPPQAPMQAPTALHPQQQAMLANATARSAQQPAPQPQYNNDHLPF